MSKETEQVKRIQEKTAALLLTGKFGDAKGFRAEDFRIDVCGFLFGAYGDCDDKSRRRLATLLGKSFMIAASAIQKEPYDEDMACLVVEGLDEAEKIVDELSARASI